MKTFAIYEQTPQGLRRLGTFTAHPLDRARKYYSVRSVSEQFVYKHPKANPSNLYIAKRLKLMGRVVDDSERIPFDCGTYVINWDNGGEACGTFPQRFRSERAAEEWAKNWARERNLEDLGLNDRQVARRGGDGCYTAEVIEVEEDDAEHDPESLPDNPRPVWL